MGRIVLSAGLIGAVGVLTGCESLAALGLTDSRQANPSGETWPGADSAAYDKMIAESRCRETLAQRDCHVVPVVTPPSPSGQPAILSPAGAPGSR